MSWDQILTGFIYLAVVLVLVVIGKWVYDALHRGFVLRTELLENDNFAMAREEHPATRSVVSGGHRAAIH